jgi:hypothetical protein
LDEFAQMDGRDHYCQTWLEGEVGLQSISEASKAEGEKSRGSPPARADRRRRRTARRLGKVCEIYRDGARQVAMIVRRRGLFPPP